MEKKLLKNVTPRADYTIDLEFSLLSLRKKAIYSEGSLKIISAFENSLIY